MKHLVLIGPPGAGKSTISDLLIQHIPLAVIASGRRLREEIAADSPIGREIGPLLEQGHFAPDTLMDRLMREWLGRVPKSQGFLLDGFPRTVPQAIALEGMLIDLRRPLDAVIALELGDAEAVRRLAGRRICVGGGEPFTLHIDDADAVERCRTSGGTLTQRDDDAPDVVLERLRVYEHETAPLIEFYRRRDLLVPVDAHGPANVVAERVLAAINKV
ncbi:nucleoside monophosphate kinase [Chloroflexales bacterium ZM16-3]|nr:nucleoside monophosphate kinase [Chloroflexales bacterium ZM16-3]